MTANDAAIIDLTLPVVAMASKPTKAKKHVAAPLVIPAIPYGANPPLPQPPFGEHTPMAWVTFSGGIAQLSGSSLNAPAMIMYNSISKFNPVKTLVNMTDSLTPTARMTERREFIMQILLNAKSVN